MAKITTKSLYNQIIEEIDSRVITASVGRKYNQSGGGNTLPLYFGDRSSGTTNASVSEIINTLQLILEEAFGSHIVSGLVTKATTPETSNVIVTSGTGAIGGTVYTLEEDTTINIPLELGPKVYYVMLYRNGIQVDTKIDTKKVLLSKIIVPTETIANRILDVKDDGGHAYIMNYRETKIYSDGYRLEEESVELFRNSIGEILADNIIGNIRLSENLKILNTQGTLEIDSKSIKIFDTSENVLAKFDKDGTHYYNELGTKIAKFGTDEAYIGNILVTANSVESRDFVSGALGAGFQILDSGNATFQNITARGKLTSSVFEYATISAIGGNLLLSKSADKLAANMTALDASTLEIDGDVTLSVGDMLRIKDATNDEWLEVTGAGSAPIYSVTRDKDAQYASDNNPAWKKGTAVVNYGQSTDGGIFLTASESNAPYLDVFTHAGSPWDTTTTHLRLGNLNGFLGYSSDLYGIAIGTTDDFLKYDPTNGLQIKGSVTITGGTASVTYTQETEPGSSGDSNTPKEGDIWFKPSTSNFYAYVSSVWESMAVGSGITDANGKLILPTSPSSAGLYLGSDYMGYYNGGWKSYFDNSGNFYFAGDGSNYIQWNGATLTVRGALTADDITTGTLAGITISGNTIQTAGSGSRVVMTSSSLVAYDDIAGEAFKVLLSGADVGDVIIGNSAGTDYVKWDKSAGTLTIRGTLSASDITTGTFTGLTIQTASSGARVVMDSTTGLVAYDNSANEIFKILVSGGDVGDVIFGGTSNYLKWDKSAGALLAANIQSPDYVANTTGYKLSSASGLEVNTGAISGLAVVAGNMGFCEIDKYGRAKSASVRDSALQHGHEDLDASSYYWSSTDTGSIWEVAKEASNVFDGGTNDYFGVWFVKRPNVNYIHMRVLVDQQQTNAGAMRTSVYGQSLRSGSVALPANTSDLTQIMSVNISTLTNGESYFYGLTHYSAGGTGYIHWVREATVYTSSSSTA